MSIEQRLISMEQRLISVERLLKAQSPQNNDVWLNDEQASALTGLSRESLRKRRYNGQLQNFRCRTSGRGFQYLKSELETLLITT